MNTKTAVDYTEQVTCSITDLNYAMIQVLKQIANGSDLKDMLIHSANELRNDPSDINHLHVKELISILSHN
tara:strand:+ start:786 stop:998 length:213 start_codon:yes stop_codon:yes gene_type:complete